jgi:MFS family permease
MGFQAGAGYLAGVLVGRFSYLRGVAYVSPIGYAICFILAFIVHMIDWIALSKLKEEPALVPGIQRSVRDTIINYPKLLRGDKNFSRYCIMRALISLGFYTSAFIIVFAKNRISVTGEMLGIFTAVNLVSIALGNYVGGQMANRIGFKRLLETAAFCVAAIYFTTSLLGSFSAFLVFFIVNGFMTGWIFISFDNLIMEFGRPDNRPSYIAISSMISGVSGILGPMTAGLIASKFSFVALFYGIGIIVMLTSIIMHFTVTDPRHIEDYWV